MGDVAISVAGGTYREVCREPEWDELFGSGLRAAARLRAMGAAAALYTYIGTDAVETLDAYAKSFDIHAQPRKSGQTFRFTYAHGLSRPVIDPPLHLATNCESLRVDDDLVLRFGMLEGDAVVNAEVAVYDPQSTYSPVTFGANGSKAERLAVVANRREARMLTGQDTVDGMGQALLDTDNAEVALIKQGSLGVKVFSRSSGVHDVPAFHSDRVFPIGSGDVFSASFAYHWAGKGVKAVEAAEAASNDAANYCATRRLDAPAKTRTAIEVKGLVSDRLVYLAGPFFTTAGRWLVSEAREALRDQGLSVFSPFHDVGIGPAEQVVSKDLQALDTSHAVLAIADGTDPGTLFEIGYARSKNIPVVAFVENEPEEPLKMLRGSGCTITPDFVTAIYQAAWAALERPR